MREVFCVLLISSTMGSSTSIGNLYYILTAETLWMIYLVWALFQAYCVVLAFFIKVSLVPL